METIITKPKCPTCNGSGWIKPCYYVQMFAGGPFHVCEDPERQCTDCHGTGDRLK